MAANQLLGINIKKENEHSSEEDTKNEHFKMDPLSFEESKSSLQSAESQVLEESLYPDLPDEASNFVETPQNIDLIVAEITKQVTNQINASIEQYVQESKVNNELMSQDTESSEKSEENVAYHIFDNKKQLVDGLVEIENKKYYLSAQCPFCKFNCTYLTTLRKHLRSVHDCDNDTAYTASTLFTLYRNIEDVTDEQYCCNKCKLRFESLEKVNMHYFNVCGRPELDKFVDKGVEEGVDKSVVKYVVKYVDKGVDKNVDKGVEKGIEKDVDKDVGKEVIEIIDIDKVEHESTKDQNCVFCNYSTSERSNLVLHVQKEHLGSVVDKANKKLVKISLAPGSSTYKSQSIKIEAQGKPKKDDKKINITWARVNQN